VEEVRRSPNFLTLDATLSLRVELPIRNRIAMFRWASFPLLVRTFPFEQLDSLAKPTRYAAFQFFLCAQAIVRINGVAFDVERDVPARNPFTTAILRDEGHQNTLAAREQSLSASVIQTGR
jgi:hypothetical protein